MNRPDEKELLYKMASYCSTAERCIRDVEQKLTASDIEKEGRERIIARLLQEKFIDETRYARFFVNDKFRFNKWGRIKIDYELQKKGIPPTVRNEALQNIDETAYTEMLYSLLANKKKTIKSTNAYDARVKLMRFAAGRGFERNETNKCLKQLFKDHEDSPFFD